MAGVWLIPKGADKPADRRYKEAGKPMLHIAICDDEKDFVWLELQDRQSMP